MLLKAFGGQVQPIQALSDGDAFTPATQVVIIMYFFTPALSYVVFLIITSSYFSNSDVLYL